MEENRKRILKLRQIADGERATALKARESWHMFTIMAEFIESTERLSGVHPAVTIFGSARIAPEHPYYQQCVDVSRRLSDAGFAVISGGGPGIMEAANSGAGCEASIGLNVDLPFEQLVEWHGAQRWVKLPYSEAVHIRGKANAAAGNAILFIAHQAINTQDNIENRAENKVVFNPLKAPLDRIHRDLKRQFDPAGIFNRGRMFADM